MLQSANASTVLLVRHALTDAVGAWLAGRSAGVPLSAAGRAQAARLGRALAARVRLDAIYASPLDRAQATAAELAHHQGLDVRTCDDLAEIDFGAWTGKQFAILDRDPAWQLFNRTRSIATIPEGEQPRDAQQRMLAAIARLSGMHPGATIALVTHAEPVRLTLLHYKSMSLDQYHELDIEPASVSAVSLSPAGAQILYVNDTTCAAE
jgi:broad specificity phosphatase PhoE